MKKITLILGALLLIVSAVLAQQTKSDCNPPTALSVYYSSNCGRATLNWGAPAGKKVAFNPTLVTENVQIDRRENVTIPSHIAAPAEASQKQTSGSTLSMPDVDGKGPNTVAYMLSASGVPTRVPLNNPGASSVIGGNLGVLPSGGDWINGAWYCVSVDNNNIYKIDPTWHIHIYECFRQSHHCCAV